MQKRENTEIKFLRRIVVFIRTDLNASGGCLKDYVKTLSNVYDLCESRGISPIDLIGHNNWNGEENFCRAYGEFLSTIS